MTHWTEKDIPDLSGKVALVTGANSGLGLDTTRGLAANGAHVVMACRGEDKARKAMDEIRQSVPEAKLEFLALDLSDLASVRTCATEFRARYRRLDILCNNAGIMAVPYGKTRDGFERQFGTNHLGHFLLTGLLLDALNTTTGARVVTVSSVAHKRGRLRLDDLNWERGAYSPPAAYSMAKLCNLIFMLELDRRLRKSGSRVLSVASHPGYAATNIGYGDYTKKQSLKGWAMQIGNSLIAQPSDRGALPSLYAAVAPDVKGGEYFGPHGLLEFAGYPVRVQPSATARDEVAGAKLWELSEQMTGLKYP